MAAEGDTVPNPESYAPFSALVMLPDGTVKSAYETNGSLRSTLQDSITRTVSLFLHEHIGGAITLTADANIDDTVLNVQAGHGAVAGNLVCLKEGIRFYQGEILSVTATTIILDTPLDFAFVQGANCTATNKGLNVDGSGIPVEFHVRPNAGVKWDILEMLFLIEGATAMDTGKFGDIAALTNGIVVRKKGLEYMNIFNIKTNGDFATRAFNVEFDPKAPAGVTAVRISREFKRQNGVVIRLDGDNPDDLQILVRDNLSTLGKFECILQGHVVEGE